MSIVGGEDFTVELQFFADAGFTRESVLGMVRAIIAEVDETAGKVYLYERESKIFRRQILEVTGTYRDPLPRPVISPVLLEQLQRLLERQND
jgi:hypothetical protein